MPINSFGALLESDLHIFAFRPEFSNIEKSFQARYAAAFRLTDNVSEVFQLRNSFNTSWAYIIPKTKWHVIETQQHYFQKPLFRYSDLCLSGNTPHSILVSEESIYREAVNLFAMRARQSGLMFHWLTHGFNDMVTAGRMCLKDYSQSDQWRILRLKDLQFAWRCCGAGLLLALIVFIVELLRFYVEVWLDNL
ncbi:GH20055 [Drosophila grimshawi]|uniref:GH20055 n=1 Tax=Drosophila grimshawi TaxID=7222 RepID=B4JRI0_DROGR|nr:GH20055 [Drosophila grimshawi]